LYSVKEVSEVLNLSLVSVYKKFKKPEIKPYIVKKEGIKYISEEGLEILKGLKDNSENTGQSKQHNNADDGILNDYINHLKEQLKQKDTQIQQLIELNKNNQILLKQEKDKVLLLEEKKKPFWSRLFNKEK
jgi:hypothetical protein